MGSSPWHSTSFLSRSSARTLSLKAIFRLSDDEAHATFAAIRFADNGGEAFCPRCVLHRDLYLCGSPDLEVARACAHQFSVTSGTIFASRKLAIRDYLAAIAIFVNRSQGYLGFAARPRSGRPVQDGRSSLAHKLREAIGAEQMKGDLSGVGRGRLGPTSAVTPSRRTIKADRKGPSADHAAEAAVGRGSLASVVAGPYPSCSAVRVRP